MTSKYTGLQLEHDDSRDAPWLSVEFAARATAPYSYRYREEKRLPFRVTIYSDGFEATRELSADDLLAIREWIDDALSAAETREG